MNESLRNRVAQIRLTLESDPEGLIAGKFGQSNVNALTGIPSWDHFLNETDGGRFGSIDIWSADELDRNQVSVSDMPGGSEVWLIIGQILYEPLAVYKATNEVVLHPRRGDSKALGQIDRFLTYFVFGDGYAELIPDVEQEEWWRLIQRKD